MLGCALYIIVGIVLVCWCVSRQEDAREMVLDKEIMVPTMMVLLLLTAAWPVLLVGWMVYAPVYIIAKRKEKEDSEDDGKNGI